jgi:hypothetical protein
MNIETNQIAYMVTQGSYSDYKVIAVFTKEEDAQEFVKLLTQHKDTYEDDFEVEKIDLNPTKMVDMLSKSYQRFLIRMNREGSVLYKTILNSYNNLASTFNLNYGTPLHNEISLDAKVWAKDLYHAIKSTNEHRTMLIANNQWPED